MSDLFPGFHLCLQLAFAFGGTEIRVRAQDVTSGEARACSVNFLGVEKPVAIEDEASWRKRYSRDAEDSSSSPSAKKPRF